MHGSGTEVTADHPESLTLWVTLHTARFLVVDPQRRAEAET